MKKKQFLIIFILLGIVLFSSSCKNKNINVSKFPEIVTKLDSYEVTGKLETFFPTGSKECLVKVFYKKPDMYRVEITRPNDSKQQIMIKNGDGVFVLLPEINKTIKVKSSWPNNSSYPYILQSLSKDILSDEDLIKTNETIELKTKIHQNAAVTKQKITFDRTTKMPKEVLIYDEAGELFIKFTFDKILTNQVIDNNVFKVEDSMESARIDVETSEFVRDITYPSYCLEGSTLKDEVIKGDKDNKQVTMTYDGEYKFTIVEKFVNAYTTHKLEFLDGDILVMGGTFFIVGGSFVKFYEEGIEYLLASTTVNQIELMKMGESLRESDIK